MKASALLLCTILPLALATAGCAPSGREGTGAVTVPVGPDDASPLTPTPAPVPTESREATLAKCLTAKGAELYGADWCPYTRQQIDVFRDGFRYLRYIECTENAALCRKKGIPGYPTWLIRGGQLPGYRSPRSLAAYAGCPW